jgi:hypothetical protein
MHRVFFVIIFVTLAKSAWSSLQDLTLGQFGITDHKQTLEKKPTPVKKNALFTKMMETEKNSEPMIIRPRIEYDDYLRIRTLPKVLGINLQMNY